MFSSSTPDLGVRILPPSSSSVIGYIVCTSFLEFFFTVGARGRVVTLAEYTADTFTAYLARDRVLVFITAHKAV
jgi:hypothetical protein